MISVQSGICTIRYVSGVDADTVPRIYRSGGVWRMTWIGGDPSAVGADCFHFNQDQ
jgi:hypothetical protein